MSISGLTKTQIMFFAYANQSMRRQELSKKLWNKIKTILHKAELKKEREREKKKRKAKTIYSDLSFDIPNICRCLFFFSVFTIKWNIDLNI